MKFNKWTLGLAAIGAVSLSSATQAKADGDAAPAPTYLESATKGISISGYVDTSIEWAIEPGTERSQVSPMSNIPFRGGGGIGASKQDGFNLNVVELNFEKAMDESPWASGFKVSLLAGPDALWYNTMDPNGNGFGDNGFAIKQAYVALRTPVGNGIDWKIGVFDTIIGYEVFEAGSNPNFTRSWGYALEPTEHEGILASYKFTDNISATVGLANTLSSGITSRNNQHGTGFDSFWDKTWMASVTLTAPQSWGFLSGSALYLGVVEGVNISASNFGSGTGDDQLNFYAGAVINTPVAGLTAGIAWDYVDNDISGGVTGGTGHSTFNNLGLYTSYKVTDKLSAHARFEYGWADVTGTQDGCWWGITGTVQYDLWANVISRLEIRHEDANHNAFGGLGTFTETSGTGLYANLIYKF